MPSSARRPCVLRRCFSSTRSAATPATHALAALMCLHAARLPGARRRVGQPDLALRPGSIAMGCAACGRRAAAPRTLGHRRRADRVSRRSRHRVRFMRSGNARRTQTGADRFALRQVDDHPPFPRRRAQPRHRHRAARRARTRARRDSRDRRPRSPRHLSFLSTPRSASSNFTAGDMKSRARALPSGARPRAQSHGATIPRAAHRGVRRQRSSPHPLRCSARPPITRDQARGQVAHPQPPQPGQNAPFGAELTTAGSRVLLTAVP